MSNFSWPQEFPAAITLCDPDGIVLDLNDRAAQGYEKDGGRALIGANLFDCHPEPSRSMLKEMMRTQRSHAYTIEKNGQKKFIYQAPWYEQGEYRGFVEIVMETPTQVPHFVRS